LACLPLPGGGGALTAPLAGRLADRGYMRAATAGARIMLGLGFFATGWAAGAAALGTLVVLAILIDAAVQGNQVVSQRILFSVPSEVRGRVNALYMTATFIGGALGSLTGSVTYHWCGWTATAATGGLTGGLLCCSSECSRNWHRRGPAIGRREPSPQWGA
jgi:predicted MFS family arabinose efflux permease